MQSRTAWIAAALAGGLAVLIVGVDLAMNLEARMETQRDEAWQLVASTTGDGYVANPGGPFAGCATPQMRLTVDNGLPWMRDVHVRIVANWFNETAQEQETLLDETWRLERGQTRQHEFTVPVAARQSADKATAHVDVWVDDRVLGTCVEAA